jgi:hypothetical protein
MSQTDMFSCISESLPAADWEQMISQVNSVEQHRSWSDAVADASMDCYDKFSSDLPNVCAGGKSCRADIRAELRGQVADVWVKVFQ